MHQAVCISKLLTSCTDPHRDKPSLSVFVLMSKLVLVPYPYFNYAFFNAVLFLAWWLPATTSKPNFWCGACGYDSDSDDSCIQYACVGDEIPPDIVPNLCDGCGLHPGENCTPWHPCYTPPPPSTEPTPPSPPPRASTEPTPPPSLPPPRVSTEPPARGLLYCKTCGYDSHPDDPCIPHPCPPGVSAETTTTAPRPDPATTVTQKKPGLSNCAQLVSKDRGFPAFLIRLIRLICGDPVLQRLLKSA